MSLFYRHCERQRGNLSLSVEIASSPAPRNDVRLFGGIIYN
ncbi:MAG: hypothetical protein ACK5IQ_06325 [Bacteroidales bacterium]